MPGMEIKHGFFGASIIDSIGNFNRVRCTPLLYFEETIILKSAKGPKPLPTTSIIDGGRDSNLPGFQSFTHCVNVRSACCIRIGLRHIHCQRVQVFHKSIVVFLVILRRTCAIVIRRRMCWRL